MEGVDTHNFLSRSLLSAWAIGGQIGHSAVSSGPNGGLIGLEMRTAVQLTKAYSKKDDVGHNCLRTFMQILMRCRAMGLKEEIKVSQASHRSGLVVMKSMSGLDPDTAESCFWGNVRLVPMYLGLTNTRTIGRGVLAIYRPTGHRRSTFQRRTFAEELQVFQPILASLPSAVVCRDRVYSFVA